MALLLPCDSEWLSQHKACRLLLISRTTVSLGQRQARACMHAILHSSTACMAWAAAPWCLWTQHAELWCMVPSTADCKCLPSNALNVLLNWQGITCRTFSATAGQAILRNHQHRAEWLHCEQRPSWLPQADHPAIQRLLVQAQRASQGQF
jgi:hypothetical protein